eukprot:Rhum_TRINITY_DN8599_c0_g1::Rhum_TRINITY_DN8599_c0_g1_i1::g.28898::m.28898
MSQRSLAEGAHTNTMSGHQIFTHPYVVILLVALCCADAGMMGAEYLVFARDVSSYGLECQYPVHFRYANYSVADAVPVSAGNGNGETCRAQRTNGPTAGTTCPPNFCVVQVGLPEGAQNEIKDMRTASLVFLWFCFAVEFFAFILSKDQENPFPVLQFVVLILHFVPAVLLTQRDSLSLSDSYAAATLFFRLYRDIFAFAFYAPKWSSFLFPQSPAPATGRSVSQPLLASSEPAATWTRAQDNRYSALAEKRQNHRTNPLQHPSLTDAEEAELNALKSGHEKFEEEGMRKLELLSPATSAATPRSKPEASVPTFENPAPAPARPKPSAAAEAEAALGLPPPPPPFPGHREGSAAVTTSSSSSSSSPGTEPVPRSAATLCASCGLPLKLWRAPGAHESVGYQCPACKRQGSATHSPASSPTRSQTDMRLSPLPFLPAADATEGKWYEPPSTTLPDFSFQKQLDSIRQSEPGFQARVPRR